MNSKYALLIWTILIGVESARTDDSSGNTNFITDLLLSQVTDNLSPEETAKLKDSIAKDGGDHITNLLLENAQFMELLKENNLQFLGNKEMLKLLLNQLAPLMVNEIPSASTKKDLKSSVKGLKKDLEHPAKSSVYLNEVGSMKTMSGQLQEQLLSQMGNGFNFDNRCKKDVLYAAQHYKESWVLRMLDSFGKPSSGISVGATSFYGSYWQCVTTVAPQRGPEFPGFKGKNCWLIWTANNMEFVKFVTATICVPDSCTSKDVVQLHPFFKEILAQQIPILSEDLYGLKFALANCHTEPEPMTTIGYVFRYAILSYLALILICTIIDQFYLTPKYHDSTLPSMTNGLTGSSTIDEKKTALLKLNGISNHPGRWITCFSLIKNVDTILNIDSVAPQTACFHGIRFLCLSWVIMGHVCMHALPSAENLEYMTKEFGELPGIFVQQGFYAVDTFFVISGFLLTYLFMKNQTDRMNYKSWFMFYFHRYIRLTPAYVIIRMWAQTHWSSLSDGPIWMSVNTLISGCPDTWLQSLVYLGNFGDVASNCLSWTWYLANDFQFFAISPPFLICLKRYPRPTLVVMSTIVACSSVLTAYISYTHGFYLMPKYVTDYVHNSMDASKKLSELTDVMYEKPYCRIGPYFVGMLLGYFYYATINKRIKINLVKQALLWIVSITLMIIIIFGPYDRKITLELATFYHGFGRVGWALAISWPIYACLKGYGGILNLVLSWKLLYPISRLSYCIYLLHPIIMFTHYYSLEKPLTASYLSFSMLWIAVVCLSAILAFLFSLAFETPFIKLEKLIRSSLTSAEKLAGSKRSSEGQTPENYVNYN